MALGHQHGVDGHFLEHFGLDIDTVKKAVRSNDEGALSEWLAKSVDDFTEKRDSWNELAPNLGREGYPMHRMLKVAVKRIYGGLEWDPSKSAFEMIELDEG